MIARWRERKMIEIALEAMNEWALIGMLVGVAAIGFPLIVIVLQWLNRGAPMFEGCDADDHQAPGRKFPGLRRRRRR